MQTEVIEVTDRGQQGGIEKACHVLRAGGIVGFPTETVYGLAANADIPAAVERLNALKLRRADKPYTLHIGSKADISRYVPRIGILNRQLIRKAWPGPVTVVFNLGDEGMRQVRKELPEHQIPLLYYDNTIGVRFPDHPAAQQMLAGGGVPVVAPSANPADQVPPHTAQEVLGYYQGQIEMVLDGGPCRYKQSSTVIRVQGEGFEVLRAGVLDEAAIRRMRSINILFVCTGNTCRSPMAEGFCRHELAQMLGCSVSELENRGCRVLSAGVMAYGGSPAAENAVEACREKGVDISGHRSRTLTEEMIHQADYLFVMDQSHRHAVLGLVSQAGEKIAKLDAPDDISDPIGQSLKKYQACARQIAGAVRQRLDEMAK